MQVLADFQMQILSLYHKIKYKHATACQVPRAVKRTILDLLRLQKDLRHPMAWGLEVMMIGHSGTLHEIH